MLATKTSTIYFGEFDEEMKTKTRPPERKNAVPQTPKETAPPEQTRQMPKPIVSKAQMDEYFQRKRLIREERENKHLLELQEMSKKINERTAQILSLPIRDPAAFNARSAFPKVTPPPVAGFQILDHTPKSPEKQIQNQESVGESTTLPVSEQIMNRKTTKIKSVEREDFDQRIKQRHIEKWNYHVQGIKARFERAQEVVANHLLNIVKSPISVGLETAHKKSASVSEQELLVNCHYRASILIKIIGEKNDRCNILSKAINGFQLSDDFDPDDVEFQDNIREYSNLTDEIIKMSQEFEAIRIQLEEITNYAERDLKELKEQVKSSVRIKLKTAAEERSPKNTREPKGDRISKRKVQEVVKNKGSGVDSNGRNRRRPILTDRETVSGLVGQTPIETEKKTESGTSERILLLEKELAQVVSRLTDMSDKSRSNNSSSDSDRDKSPKKGKHKSDKRQDNSMITKDQSQNIEKRGRRPKEEGSRFSRSGKDTVSSKVDKSQKTSPKKTSGQKRSSGSLKTPTEEKSIGSKNARNSSEDEDDPSDDDPSDDDGQSDTVQKKSKKPTHEKRPDIHTFEGGDAGEATFWLRAFINATDTMNWSKIDKAKNFSTYLTGSARKWFTNEFGLNRKQSLEEFLDPKPIKWKKILTAFYQHYLSDASCAHFIDDFNNFTPKSDEKWTDMCQRYWSQELADKCERYRDRYPAPPPFEVYRF